MEMNELKPIIESLIFVSEEPMTLELMAMVFEEHGFKKKEIAVVVEEIVKDYSDHPERGIRIVEVAGGYQFRTKTECAEWIKRLNVPRPVRLSQPAMETLAIVAYRQPVVRSGVEEIRGVDSGGVLKTLLEKSLIRIIGKSDDVGNPLVYATTKEFLEMFSLSSLKELPTLKEIDQLEIQEKVGMLGKDSVAGETVSEGVKEVMDQYKEEVLEYKPDPEKFAEDERAIKELESSVKNVRKLEKEIFPKPKEELTAVLKEGEEASSNSSETPNSQEETDERKTPQNTGQDNETL